ncbi:MAG: RluA family pseudouridine synthase [Acidimicrobiales bacterium]
MSDPRTIEESIPDALSGERIDRVVALVADVSRREAVQLIASGGVRINGVPPEKPSLRVEAGTTVAIDVADAPVGLEPDPDVVFRIVHTDDHTIVVDKPAHLVVHPGSGVKEGTLANGLLAAFPEIMEVGDPERPGIVHRLDKGTSGLLMVARTAEAYDSLVGQLAARTVSRVYRALVGGLIESNGGLIDAPLGRSLRDATRRAVVADGRPARTGYEVIRRYENPGCTLVECRLETGRTHQIRAHLAAIDHPVVGDERYGGEAMDGLPRPFLHAAHLGFDHPDTGHRLEFDSPLPDDLEAVLSRLADLPPWDE